MIFTHNIYDFLGKGRAKYHSAFITTYAFDLSYFSLEAVPALRRTGARNILAIVDEHYLNYLLDLPILKIFKNDLRFGIQAIESKGVFHPKIMLLLGEKEGFLAVGSGNQTAAGNGLNKELWSVFHYKGKDSQNAEIFAQAIMYFEKLSENFVGLSKDKWLRSREFTSWTNELPSKSLNQFSNYQNESIGLFSFKSPLFEELGNLTDSRKVLSISVLSPFYDKAGDFILELQRKFAPEVVNVVLDLSSNALPFKLQPNDFRFYDWQKCISDNEPKYRRLHAKLISLNLDDGSEIIISGSGNATVAAMGGNGQNPKNEEVCIVSIRKNSNIFSELGIRLKKKYQIDLPPEPSLINSSSAIKHQNFLIKILDVYRLGETWNVILNKNLKDPAVVFIKSSSQEILFKKNFNELEGEFLINIESSIIPFSIYIENITGDRISNIHPIQDEAFHFQSNPDPSQAELEAAIAELEHGDYAVLGKVLSYVKFDIDKTSGQISTEKVQERSNFLEKSRIESVTLSKEEFQEGSQRYYAHLLNSGNIKIVEVLRLIANQKFKTTEKGLEKEDHNSGIYEGDLHDDPLRKEIRMNKFLPQLRRANDYFVKKYIRHITEKLQPILCTSTRRDILKVRVDLHELSNVVIVLHLMRVFLHNKDFQVLNAETGKEEFFTSIYGQKAENAINVFTLEGLSKFSLLYQYGMEKTGSEVVNNKIKELELDLLNLSIFHVCNLYWNREVVQSYKVVMLNLLKGYFHSNPDFELSKFKSQFKHFRLSTFISHGEEKPYFESGKFQTNLNVVFNKIIPAFENFLKHHNNGRDKIIKKSDALRESDLIYFSALGFCIFEGFQTDKKNNIILNLKHVPLYSGNGCDLSDRRKEYANQVLVF
ncbi:hypothetical protein [Salinimicrobium gaetbulicola]|uniref:Phospholipase D-like protein n=1 Tax=Salinimicrobium gaetbulicola TaxID=999702 RepID=A0ABW3IH35_9FLAO